MKFCTTRFGEIEYPAEVVLEFPEGVLGFPQETHYILLEHTSEGSPFKWLQSLENADLAFIVVDPFFVEPRFQFEIDLDTARLIGTDNQGDCAVMCIVNVPREMQIRMTANLKAPLLVNVESRRGRQAVLGSQSYSVSTLVFPQAAATNEQIYQQRAAV